MAKLAVVCDRWSDSYYEYMGGDGYRHPVVCMALLAGHVPRNNVRILGTRVGKGIVGD